MIDREPVLKDTSLASKRNTGDSLVRGPPRPRISMVDDINGHQSKPVPSAPSKSTSPIASKIILPKLDLTSIGASKSLSPLDLTKLADVSESSRGSRRQGGNDASQSSSGSSPFRDKSRETRTRGGGDAVREKRLNAHPHSIQLHPQRPAVTSVSLPPGREEISLKELADLINCSLDRILSRVLDLGALPEVDLIPSRVLEQIRGGRLTSRHAITQTASSILLPMETAELVLLEMGIKVTHTDDSANDRVRSVATDQTPRRAPIVVVMGHVDHGKTTLLDALRNTNLVAQEQGGITQAIAAFRVDMPGGGPSACFLDTPGHEAFSSMRKSGTAVTDVACVVIAATDGVMPQTIESVKYAREAHLPIVFAITKSDLAKQKASKELSDEDIETSVIDQLNVHSLFDENRDVVVKVVAPLRLGLDELLEAIKLQVEMDDASTRGTSSVPGTPSGPLARSEERAPGEAVVLESKIDRALGPVADVVVRWGTLRVGDFVVCDEQWARVRRLERADGTTVTSCPPATPVRLSGFDHSLSPGADVLAVTGGERECKRIVEFRIAKRLRAHERDAKLKLIRDVSAKKSGRPPSGADGADKAIKRKSLAEKKMQRKMQQEKLEEVFTEQEVRREKEVRVILKADAEGSLNALSFAVKQMKDKQELPESHELVVVKAAVGPFSEQDLDLAKTTGSYLLGFNLKTSGAIMKKAKNLNIKGMTAHPVIYNLLEEFALRVATNVEEAGQDQKAAEEALKPKGAAQVLSVFDLKGKDKKQVAGVRVIEGVFNKNDVYAVKRNGEVLVEFKPVDSLRVVKDSVPSVEKGAECGIALKDFVGFQIGDIIEAYDANVLQQQHRTQ